jgi:hypothetical protein
MKNSLIILAGTQGDQLGGQTEMRGPGFSLGREALQVPVIASFPDGAGTPRDAGALVWAPDVPATIAGIAGVRLSDQAEGISLLEEPSSERVVFAWSWATRDQLGWKARRSARSGPNMREEGLFERSLRLDSVEDDLDPDVAARLERALAERRTPAKVQVPLDTVAPLLEEHGLVLEPVPTEGRDMPPNAEARPLARLLWNARRSVGRGNFRRAMKNYTGILERDPENLGALLDRGQLLTFTEEKEGLEILGRAAELYPDDPEILHWYAHALWPESWEAAERLLLAIVPYKPYDGDVLYDLACARTLSGDLDGAEEYLRRAFEAGFREWDTIDVDPDLREFRQSPRFAELVREYRQ